MLGGFDTNVAICVIKPKKFVRYEHKFLRRLLVMVAAEIVKLLVVGVSSLVILKLTPVHSEPAVVVSVKSRISLVGLNVNERDQTCSYKAILNFC